MIFLEWKSQKVFRFDDSSKNEKLSQSLNHVAIRF